MGDPFIGEIRAFGFDFPPRDWVTCNGQLLKITQYQAIYSLLGTNYGGDGRSNFGVPNLNGRAAMHYGSGSYTTPHVIGQAGGNPTVQLNQQTIPNHNHTITAGNANGTATTPGGNYPAKGNTKAGKISNPWPSYVDAAPAAEMASHAIAPTGSNLPHENRQPYLVLNYCLSLTGIWPSRT
jgi:microcystin-dependent protein